MDMYLAHADVARGTEGGVKRHITKMIESINHHNGHLLLREEQRQRPPIELLRLLNLPRC